MAAATPLAGKHAWSKGSAHSLAGKLDRFTGADPLQDLGGLRTLRKIGEASVKIVEDHPTAWSRAGFGTR